MAVAADGLPPLLRWPATVQTMAGIALPEAFPAWLLRRYGDERAVRMKLIGLGEVAVFSDAAGVKEIFTADREVVRAGEANAQVIGGAVGPGSLLTLDGDRHIATRRLLLPPFHGDAIRSYATLVEAIATAEVESWPIGRPFATLPRMKSIALEVILRSVIGAREGSERIARLRALLPRVLNVNGFVVVAESRYPRLGTRLFPWVRARLEVGRLLREEIAEHRASPAGRDDVLALLVATELSDDELHDQLITLLLAGHETTAVALSWAFERLVRHPAALARLEEEVLAGDGQDAYLGAVINETLRARPPLEAVWRKLSAPLEVAGYTLPAGTFIAVPVRGVGRRPEAWEDPYAFRPERFLDGSPVPYTLIPFGGGPRRCIGASLAVMEMKTVLRVALERFALAAPGGRAERQSRVQSFTTVPSRGGRVVATARRARPAR